MSRHHSLASKAFQGGVSLGLVAAVGLIGVAHASVNVQNLSTNWNLTYLATESTLPERPSVWPEGRQLYPRVFAGAVYSWVKNPLVELDDAGALSRVWVRGIHTLELSGGYYVSERFLVGVRVPLAIVDQLVGVDQSPQSGGFALEDMSLHARFRLTPRSSSFGLGMTAKAILPTGNPNMFVGDSGVGFGLGLVIEKEFGWFRAAANLGYLLSTQAIFENINYRNRFPFSIGASIPLGKSFSIQPEWVGAVTLPLGGVQNPAELLLSATYWPRWKETPWLTMTAGVGLGGLSSSAASTFRIFAGFRAMLHTPTKARSHLDGQVDFGEVRLGQAQRVVYTPTEIQVTGEVLFETGKDVLMPEGKDLLNEVADTLRQHHGEYKRIEVQGHTDDIGSDEYNQDLSQRRANSVKVYLISRGTEAESLNAVGYGKSQPKALPSLSDESRRAMNRRVEFKLK